mmetsp:Transcript_41359/g.125187  ORF Transcript_41359/g.125187 Transcript_41359/m.125187 type:complete len:218 (-) Transcript_41359:350-1003(-)
MHRSKMYIPTGVRSRLKRMEEVERLCPRRHRPNDDDDDEEAAESRGIGKVVFFVPGRIRRVRPLRRLPRRMPRGSLRRSGFRRSGGRGGNHQRRQRRRRRIRRRARGPLLHRGRERVEGVHVRLEPLAPAGGGIAVPRVLPGPAVLVQHGQVQGRQSSADGGKAGRSSGGQPARGPAHHRGFGFHRRIGVPRQGSVHQCKCCFGAPSNVSSHIAQHV